MLPTLKRYNHTHIHEVYVRTKARVFIIVAPNKLESDMLAEFPCHFCKGVCARNWDKNIFPYTYFCKAMNQRLDVNSVYSMSDNSHSNCRNKTHFQFGAARVKWFDICLYKRCLLATCWIPTRNVPMIQWKKLSNATRFKNIVCVDFKLFQWRCTQADELVMMIRCIFKYTNVLFVCSLDLQINWIAAQNAKA